MIMSNHEYREIDDAADARHNTPPHFEDGAEEIRDVTRHDAPPMGAPANAFWTQGPDAHDVAMPSRMPGQSLIHPYVAEPMPPLRPDLAFTGGNARPLPHFGAGLSWQASAHHDVRPDLVNYGFDRLDPHDNRPMVSNIELRTIYAHLLETAGAVRAEMRERGMQVDL